MADPVSYTHLGLDTSALIAAGWPNPSVHLANVVESCRSMEIRVLMPELALAEAEAVWVRKTAEAIEKADAAIEKAAWQMRGLRLVDLAGLPWPDRDARLDYYRRTVAGLKEAWNWVVVPLPDVALREAVLDSLAHEPPFAPTDSGFRDSVLMWSLLQAVPKGSTIGLIAEDRSFKKPHIDQATKRRGVCLHVYQSPQEAWRDTEMMIKNAGLLTMLDEWNVRNEQLKAAVEVDREHLDEFVAEQLRVSEYPSGVNGRVESVREVHVRGIDLVHGMFGEKPTDATIMVAVTVNVVVTSLSGLGPRTLGIGEVFEVGAPAESVKTAEVEIDGTAHVSVALAWPKEAEGALSLTYGTVRFSTAEEDRMQRKALIEAMKKPNR